MELIWNRICPQSPQEEKYKSKSRESLCEEGLDETGGSVPYLFGIDNIFGRKMRQILKSGRKIT